MPEAEENKQELVDIDTSGPGAEIEIDEPKEKVEVVMKQLRRKLNQLKQQKKQL